MLEQGDLQNVPVLTEDERKIIIEAALALNEAIPSVQTSHGAMEVCGRPGDEYNERGDIRALLTHHGWTCVRCGVNECWRRPGKDCGWSATLRDRVFYVFSSNAAPFEPNHPYAPFAVYALLEHQGDFVQAAGALREEGFGSDVPAESGDVDISSLVANLLSPIPERGPTVPDPGPIPECLFHVPGFISQVMNFTMTNAPYPNIGLAFCGAMGPAVVPGRTEGLHAGRPAPEPVPVGAGQQRNRQGFSSKSQFACVVRGWSCRRPGR